MSTASRRADEERWTYDVELLAADVSNGEHLDVDEHDDDEPDEDEVDVVNQAADFARAGLRVFPVLRSADKSKDKKPPPGFLWKDRSSDQVSDVVQEFTAAVLAHGADFIAVAWALGLDGFCAVDDDTGLPAELGELLRVPHAVNVTKRGCHRIYRQPTGMTPGNSTRGFPVEGWGEFRGVGGYIVITGADRPGLDVDELIDVAEFPRPGWLRDAGESVTAADNRTVVDFLHKHVGNIWPKALDVVTGKLNAETGSRHESLKHALPWAMRDARAGFYPATVAVERLREWWREAMDDPARREGPEFSGLLAWAIGCAQTETDDAIAQRAAKADRRPPPGVDPDTGEILDRDTTTSTIAGNLPDEYWTARPVLAHIRQAAHSRTRSADAVLAVVIARVAALTPPTVRVPAIVGTIGTLDLIVSIVGPSGAGKTTANDIGTELLPIGPRRDIIDGLTIGSGEGLIDAYLGPPEIEEDGDGTKRRVRRQIVTSILAVVDEGQALAELTSRRGSTLMPTLRTGWSGGTLGQANAAAETWRRVEAGRYRLAAVIGWQPDHAARILDDAAGGTPQRMVWFTGTDPAIPDTPPDWPGPINYTPPVTYTSGTILEVDDGVTTEIRRRALSRARGDTTDTDPLDAHHDLCRLKIAAVHAELDGRLDINPDDWRLAGMVMASSRSVRSTIVEHARAELAKRDGARIRQAVARDTAVTDNAETRALTSAARSISRRVHRDQGTEVTRREITQAIRSNHRKLVTLDEIIEAAIAEGWIVAASGDNYIPGESRPA